MKFVTITIDQTNLDRSDRNDNISIAQESPKIKPGFML